MAAPFALSSAKKGSNPSPAKAFAFVSNSRPFLAFSNASFVQFDSSNQEVFFADLPSSSTIGIEPSSRAERRKFTFRLSFQGVEKGKIARLFGDNFG